MRQSVIIKGIALAFLVIQCSCSIFHWEKDVVENGIPFVKFRVDKQAATLIGRTDQNFTIDTFEVEKGWVHFYPNWKLKAFQTARPVILKQVSFPSGTWLFLDPLGYVDGCVFPDDIEVQGIMCKGGGGVSGITTSFYPSGRINSCYPLHDIIIDGIPCSKTVFFPVSLYEDGHLKSCKLSADYNHANQILKKGTRISIDPDGTVHKRDN